MFYLFCLVAAIPIFHNIFQGKCVIFSLRALLKSFFFFFLKKALLQRALDFLSNLINTNEIYFGGISTTLAVKI